MKYNKPKIGVYVCHCGMNIAPKVDVEKVVQYAQKLDHVVVARDYKFMCSNPGQELIINDIKELGLNRVVEASCSPRMHEITFRNACEQAGLNPYYFQMANIREHASWVTDDSEAATEKAMDLVAAAVTRVYAHAPLQSREVSVKKSVLIIGAGIAGMQAALTAAEAGFDVHLVEREPSIGGNMVKFDKTFPTFDCAACISTPKTVSVGQHPKINMLTYSEVTDVEGFVGNYSVTVRRKPRFILEDKCTGCGECAAVCPVDMPSSYDEGLVSRKAVYRNFPQAVPLTFCVDKMDRAPCTLTCPAGVNVQGYVQLTGLGKYEEAVQVIMEKIPLPGVLGRVCPHACETECRRKEVDAPVAIRELKRVAADHVDFSALLVPDIQEREQKVAIIGSGPAGLTTAYDLRLMGYQVTIFEALPEPGGMLRVGIPDYRLPRDVLDREIGYIERLGVDIKTGVAIGTDMTLKALSEKGFSAIFIATGAHSSIKMNIPGEDDTKGVIDAIHFLKEVNLGSRETPGKEVVVIGGGNVAVDTACVSRRLGAEVTIVYRRSQAEMPAYEEELRGAIEEGVSLSCLTTPKRIISEQGRVTGLECIRTELGPVDESGRRSPVPIEGSEFIIPCDSIIPAIGQRIDAPWAENVPGIEWSERHTIKVNPSTMQTRLSHVFAGGDRVTGPATVIEAISAGHRASSGIHNFLQGIKTEQEDDVPEAMEIPERWQEIPSGVVPTKRAAAAHIDGNIRRESFDEVSSGLTVEQAASEAGRCINCGGCCECMQCVSVCEVGAVDHNMPEEIIKIDTGAIILATGFKIFNPAAIEQYGYGRFPEVYTSLEFERLSNATGPTGGRILMKDGRVPERVAIVHCAGSRDENYRKYCSRVCCMYSLKIAHLVKDKTGADVWNFYIDIRSPGKLYEEFYGRVQEEGVNFIRGKVAEITDVSDNPMDKGRLTVVAEDTMIDEVLRLPVDMVILSVGLDPAPGSDDIGRITGVSRDSSGWFSELHAKMAPVSTPINGIYLAGCCQGPKDIPDTVAQSTGAAGEAIALLSKGTVRTRAEISYIDPDICSGCKTCIDVCAYSAISFDDARGISVVNEALCQGCGSCSTACPSSAAGVRHFTGRQIMGEIEALLT